MVSSFLVLSVVKTVRIMVSSFLVSPCIVKTVRIMVSSFLVSPRIQGFKETN